MATKQSRTAIARRAALDCFASLAMTVNGLPENGP
jgi:hypothetical protein